MFYVLGMWEWLIVMHYILELWNTAELRTEKKFDLGVRSTWNLGQMGAYESAEIDYKNPKVFCDFPSAL